MKTIKFNQDFSKLNNDLFSTIRRANYRIKLGEPVLIKSPSMEFKAIPINRVKVRICEVSTKLLLQDTDTSTRGEAMELLNKFYPNLQETDMVSLLWFEQVKIGSVTE